MRFLSSRKLSIVLPLLALAFAMGTAILPTVHSQQLYAVNKAEPMYKLSATGQVAMRFTGTLNLFGTSTLHNWTMTAHQLQGTAQFNLTDNGELESVSALTFILPVHNLKGEKDGLNDNAYEALKADKYKDIRFVMTNSKITPSGSGKYVIHANGNLTIAGVTRPIAMDVNAQVQSNGTVTCQGSYALKMSDYNVDRPSFMLGAMKTGDALTLTYSLVFVK